jgi:hypothetical protein
MGQRAGGCIFGRVLAAARRRAPRFRGAKAYFFGLLALFGPGLSLASQEPRTCSAQLL